MKRGIFSGLFSWENLYSIGWGVCCAIVGIVLWEHRWLVLDALWFWGP